MFGSVPFVAQQDINDCGPACIAMIAQYYGYHISIAKAYDLSGTSMRGTTLHGILMAYQKIGLVARVVRVEKENILQSSFTLPCIAHVISSDGVPHYVVIYKITARQIMILDPQKGKIKISTELFLGENDYYKPSGIFVLIAPQILSKKGSKLFCTHKNSFVLLKAIGRIVKKRIVTFGFFLAINLIGIFMLFHLLNNTFKDRGNIRIIECIFLCIFLVMLFLITRGKHQLAEKLAIEFNNIYSLNFHEQILSLPLPFFEKRTVENIFLKYENLFRVSSMVSWCIVVIFIDFPVLIIGIVYLYKLNWGFLLLFFSLFIIQTLSVLSININSKTLELEMTSDASYLISKLVSAPLYKIEGIKIPRDSNVIKLYFKKLIQFQKNNKNIWAIIKTIESINLIVLIILGMSLCSYVTLSYMICLCLFFRQVFLNCSFVPTILFSISKEENILLETFNFSLDGKEHKKINEFLDPNGGVKFEKVGFSYVGKERLFDNLSFEIMPGDKIALVGPSGSGKTTVCKLLLNLHSLDFGKIIVYGSDIANIENKLLRNRVAYVPHEASLIKGSIIENILLGNNDVRDFEIIKICKMVYFHDFVSTLSNGYHTLLNGAAFLSSSEKQKIALVRALLKKPKVLILDEATSHMNLQEENKILNNIIKDNPELIIIIISNRLETFECCNRFFIITNGNIVEKNDMCGGQINEDLD